MTLALATTSASRQGYCLCEALGLQGERLQRQRVHYARDLLEETTLSVEEIAMRAGFGTATNFRQHFRVATGLPPATYRSRFHRDAEARAR